MYGKKTYFNYAIVKPLNTTTHTITNTFKKLHLFRAT